MVVTIGEVMAVANGRPHAPLGVHSDLRLTFAGAEANVAVGLSRLGHPVRLLTVLGDDGFGHTIRRALRGEGVDVSAVQFDASRPTGAMFKDRHFPTEPEVHYYRAGSAMAGATAATFDARLWRDARALFLTGITPALSAGCYALVREVVADAERRQIPVWLDPNYRRKLWDERAFAAAMAELVPHADVVLPGVTEGRIMTGEATVDGIVRALRAAGARTVIVKDGRRAATDGPAGGSVVETPALDAAAVVDPIGAGDAFAAGCLSAYLDGLPPAAWLTRGHVIAARVCLTEGDWEGLPTRAELARFEGRTGEAGR
ncbi:MAG TPA: sugar kinase [Tepidisphaeraceae bacterium]|nr:sugar kinase [Tepidisphaeraceae bacterium]